MAILIDENDFLKLKKKQQKIKHDASGKKKRPIFCIYLFLQDQCQNYL